MAELPIGSGLVFTGAIPELYDLYMVPMLFEPYAEDMAARVAALAPKAVLETAAGSGVVTRALAPLLAADARLEVTDLSPAMLERAKARQPVDARIGWTPADALSLPFADASFDVVFCQFGVMFFPDRVKGFAEARRVLKPGGVFLFNAWEGLDANAVPATVHDTMAKLFPDNPADFFARIPHGYHDPARIEADVKAAGFTNVTVTRLTKPSTAPSPHEPAMALVQGTPLRNQILAREPEGLGRVTAAVEAALRERFGDGPITATISALVVEARG